MRTQNIAGVRYTPWEVVGVVQPSVAVNRDSCMAKVVMQIMICVCKTSQTIKHAIYVVLPYSPHLRETVVITTWGVSYDAIRQQGCGAAIFFRVCWGGLVNFYIEITLSGN